MRKDFGAKGWMFPLPVLVVGTYGSGRANAMAVAWGAICNAVPPCIALNVDADRKTLANIRETGEFTVSPATEATLAQADYVGLVHGHDFDKIAACGLHPVRAPHVNAPLFEELPMTLECRTVSIAESGDCIRIVGEIVNVCADESILGENGSIDPAKLHPIILDTVNATYLTTGTKIGNAYHDGLKYNKK